jgi:hypothetical protein
MFPRDEAGRGADATRFSAMLFGLGTENAGFADDSGSERAFSDFGFVAGFLTAFLGVFFATAFFVGFLAGFLGFFAVTLLFFACFFGAVVLARDGLRSFCAFRFLTTFFLAFATPNSSIAQTI